MAQSVKSTTLDSSSGHDLMVCEFEPCNGLCADCTEPAWDSPSSSSLCSSPTGAHALALKINKYTFFLKEKVTRFYI